MKNLKLKNLFVLFLVILTTSVACNLLKPEEPTIFTGNPEKEFLGIPWGCNLENLNNILDKSAFPTKFLKVDSHSFLKTYQYQGNHRLPNAKYSVFMFSSGKLVDIGVLFFAESENDARHLFDKLKEKMKEELGKVAGVDFEKYDKVRIFYGNKGDMSFSLEYGGELIDMSNTSVILSAKKRSL
jgi:hypothetical protein